MGESNTIFNNLTFHYNQKENKKENKTREFKKWNWILVKDDHKKSYQLIIYQKTSVKKIALLSNYIPLLILHP